MLQIFGENLKKYNWKQIYHVIKILNWNWYTCTYTHIHIYIYTYVYVYICVCVCDYITLNQSMWITQLRVLLLLYCFMYKANIYLNYKLFNVCMYQQSHYNPKHKQSVITAVKLNWIHYLYYSLLSYNVVVVILSTLL